VSEAVLILHVSFAAAWFGHKLLIPKDVRTSVRHPESAALLVTRMSRAQRLGIASGLGTLATGLWLMHLSTGLTSASVETYAALAAVFAMFVVGGAVASPAWAKIRSAIEAEDTPGAMAGVSGFNKAQSLESLLWVFALVMMVIG